MRQKYETTDCLDDIDKKSECPADNKPQRHGGPEIIKHILNSHFYNNLAFFQITKPFKPFSWGSSA